MKQNMFSQQVTERTGSVVAKTQEFDTEKTSEKEDKNKETCMWCYSEEAEKELLCGSRKNNGALFIPLRSASPPHPSLASLCSSV